MEKFGEESRRFFVGRSAEVGILRDALADDDVHGAIVVGGRGTGKTSVVREALDGFSPGRFPYRVVRVRGSLLAARYDYGALAFLGEGLDDLQRADAAVVRREFRRALLPGDDTLPTLLLVENANVVDARSSELIQGMVRRREVKLLATADRLDRGGYLRLWMEGRIRRIDLPPLDQRESARLVDHVLGGPASGPARRALHAATRGNPRLLKLSTGAQRAAGTLIQRHGVWIKVGAFVHPEGTTDVVEPELHELDPVHREVIELLAASDRLPLDVLERLAPGADTDALLRSELLEVVSGSPLMVRVRDRTLSEFVSANLAPGRSRALFDRTMRALGPRDLPDACSLGVASWALRCGGTLDNRLVVRAARLANDRGDPDTALLLATAETNGGESAQLALEEARALLGLGRRAPAAHALERLARASADEELEHRVSHGMFRSRLSRAASEPSGEPEAILGHLATQIELARATSGGEGSGATVRVDRLREEVLVEELDVLSSHGRYEALAVAAQRAREVVGGTNLRLAVEAYGAEAFIVTGHLARGRQMLAQARERAEDPDVHPRIRELVWVKALWTGFLGGEFAWCDETLQSGRVSRAIGIHGSFGDVLQGLVLTLANHPADAALVLHPATQQLTHADPEGLLPLASAAHALAMSFQGGAVAQSGGHGVPTAPPAPRWDTQWATTLFRALALTAGGNRLDAVPMLTGLSDDALARGAVLPSLVALSAAAATGDHPSLLHLQRAAQGVEGRFAEWCRELCAGTLTGDPDSLLRAAGLAAACGDQLLARSAARATRLAGNQTDDRTRGRTARRLEHAGGRRAHGHRATAQVSEFELQLITAVADRQSSAAIGEKLHLSRRTVDWHLGRLYRKLHVAGRRELGQFLLDPRSS